MKTLLHSSSVNSVSTLFQKKKNQFYNLTIEQRARGFTLIELLVVISIIAILAGLLMANFVGVRQRGRDAQRKSTMRQIQSALEFYRADNGKYPTTAEFPQACDGTLQSGSTVYMQKVPCDPVNSTPYYYDSDTNTYCIRTCLENENDSEKDTPNNPPINGCDLIQCTDSDPSFTVQNP